MTPTFASAATSDGPSTRGLGPLITMRPPWRFESFAGHVRRPAPLLGEHTRSVLSELAGYTPQTLDALEDAGVFV